MAASSHQIQLSFDLWTSPNSIAIMAIVGHFANANLEYKTRLLAMPRVSGVHSGENLAPYLLRAIEDYDLQGRLEYFQSDNHEVNDVIVRLLANRLGTFKDGNRRIRCIGHIINLIAKAFIEGASKNLLSSAASQRQAPMTEKEEADFLEQWGGRGPIGKLHNLVHWVRKTPQRRDAFIAITKGQASPEDIEQFGQPPLDKKASGLQLAGDNDT
ncbi:hypothetical protein V8F06_014906 [Rhypophila decipiens]